MEVIDFEEMKKEVSKVATEKLVEEVNKITERFGERLSEILGDYYITLRSEYDELDEKIKKSKEEFFSSSNYVEAKILVSSLNEKIKAEEDIEVRENLYKELKIAISNLSTLNVTINNRLKSSRERREQITKEVKLLFDNNKEELISLRDGTMNDVGKIITALVKWYRIKVDEMRKEYGVENDTDSFPFDPDGFKVSIVTSKLESDSFYKLENPLKTDVDIETIEPGELDEEDPKGKVIFTTVDDTEN